MKVLLILSYVIWPYSSPLAAAIPVATAAILVVTGLFVKLNFLPH